MERPVGSGPCGCQPPYVEIDQRTVRALFESLRQVYEQKDMAGYERLFDHVEFEFEFDPIVIEENPKAPPSWGWEDESRATASLFNDETTLAISLDFDLHGPIPVDPQDGSFPDETYRVVLDSVNLAVTRILPGESEERTLRVVKDRALFFVRIRTDLPPDSPVTWVILHWREEVVGSVDEGDLSWGELKLGM